MIRSMYSGVSGMINHQVRMDVISNNIANVNTTAFKAGRTSFKDTLYMALDSTGGGRGTSQIGTGVNVSSIYNDFSQGTMQPTGRTLDVAIAGRGFFAVMEGETGRLKYTRDGTFTVDNEGYLINAMGMRLVGFGDDAIQIGEGSDSDYTLDDICIDEEGNIFAYERTDGGTTDEKIEIGQIKLFDFHNAAALTKTSDNLYLANNSTGEEYNNEDDPERFGIINSGYLETTNVNLAQELTDLITTHRGYQANARVFTTADEILREIIELKR